MQIHTLGYEVAFQYRGFSAISELHVRMLDPRRAGRLPFTPWWQFTPASAKDTSFYGGYLQAGYFLPIPGMERKLELAARVEGIGGVDPRQRRHLDLHRRRQLLHQRKSQAPGRRLQDRGSPDHQRRLRPRERQRPAAYLSACSCSSRSRSLAGPPSLTGRGRGEGRAG